MFQSLHNKKRQYHVILLKWERYTGKKKKVLVINLNAVYHLCKCIKWWKIMQAAIRITCQSSNYVLVIKYILEALINPIPYISLVFFPPLDLHQFSFWLFQFFFVSILLSCKFLGATALYSRAGRRSSRAVTSKLSIKIRNSNKYFSSSPSFSCKYQLLSWNESSHQSPFPKYFLRRQNKVLLNYMYRKLME